jgi:GT2 family glycosyltransferase
MSALRFPAFEHPRASIVILAWRQTDLLLACLDSLAKTLDGTVPFEVIVVSNGARQDLKDSIRRHAEGLRLLEAEVNLGFAAGNNLGAAVTRGEYIIFVNDDAQVASGWLSRLVATADAHPRAGAVGSLILFPDGRVQEAGSILWADGSTMPIGRELPSYSLDWHFVRRVDYVSACSLLVKKDAWMQAGGFDPDYHPAYYEDVDLCLALRALGREVLFEPRSRVWHHESTSSDSRFKTFLFERNQRRLRAKWATELTFQEPAAPESARAIARAVWRARGTPRRVLIVDDRVPDPGLGAGFGRMFTAVLDLADAGYAVSVFPTVGHHGGVPDDLVSAGLKVITGDLESHLSFSSVAYDAIIVSRPHNFERVVETVRVRQPMARVIYDCEALFWRRMLGQAAQMDDSTGRSRLEAEAASMRTLEERIVVESDHAVTVSDEEAAILRAVPGACRIQPILPAEPMITPGPAAVLGRRGIGYVAGWMAGSGSPNGDGLRWFAASVLPLIRASLPWVQVDVTGANPPDDLLPLSNPNLRFVGYVHDLAAFYAARRVIIVPIRFGAGVKIKTVQALQYGVPVVATRCGAEGITIADPQALVVRDDPEEFAAAVLDVLNDAHRWYACRAAIDRTLQAWEQRAGAVSWRHVVDQVLVERGQ